MKAKRYILILLALLILLLSGCNKKEEADGAFSTEAGEFMVYERLGEDTLLLSVWGFDTFNPIATSSEAVCDAAFLAFDPLFRLDKDYRAVPMLSSGYSVSDDCLTYEVHLREKVKFHDGTEFTASDVVYTVHEIETLKMTSQFYENVLNIEEIKAKGKNTVIIKLYSPDPLFINNLTFPIVKNGYSSEDKITEPVGTGPFKFIKSTLVRAMYFEANEDYFLGAPKIKNAVVKLLPEKDMQTYAIEAGQSDALCVTEEALSRYNPKGAVKTVYYNNRNLTFIGINTKKAFLSYQKARQAINKAIDKKDIVNSVMYGNGEAVNLPFPYDSFIYPEEYKDTKKDTAAAVSLLTEAGFVKGSDGIFVLEEDGEVKVRAKVGILVNMENEQRVSAAEKIKASLLQAGILAYIDKTDFETYKMRIETGEYDMFIGEVKTKLSFIPTALAGRDAYFSIYSSESMEEAIKKVLYSKGDEEIKNAYYELSKCYMEKMSFVPLFFERDAMLVSSSVKNADFAVSKNEFSNLYLWEKSE